MHYKRFLKRELKCDEWPRQWLLNEWPEHLPEPEKYYLSTLPETCTLAELVQTAHQRWHIERDYQELKQEFGLAHYEGRGWRGFHLHASLSIAAYGFLPAERLAGHRPGTQENRIRRQAPSLPQDYVPRGAASRATPCAGLDSHPALSTRNPARRQNFAISLLRAKISEITLVTQ